MTSPIETKLDEHLPLSGSFTVSGSHGLRYGSPISLTISRHINNATNNEVPKSATPA